MSRLFLRNCKRILTLDDAGDSRTPEILSGDIVIENGRFVRIGAAPGELEASRSQDKVLDASGLTALPGFVQAHVHLCQTPFRNTADDLSLLDWLRLRIWPGEASLTERGMKLAASLGAAEALLNGTTCVLDMASLRHARFVLEALGEAGLRGISGNCLMDDPEFCPPYLRAEGEAQLKETEELFAAWSGYDTGRLNVAVTPRFALSCTPDLMQKTVRLADRLGARLHTHASENKQEIELVRKKTGLGNLEYLEKIGFLSERTMLAHCVHLEDGDLERLARTITRVLHCPGANLKLGSGIAPVPDMMRNGITVALGSDGAPCNNSLDSFQEMRLAALQQKPFHGPEAMNAHEVLKMATREGAKALGLEAGIGALRPGMQADLILVDLEGIPNQPAEDPFAALVYSANSRDTRHVIVAGKILVQDGALRRGEPENWRAELQEILQRAKTFP